MSAPLSCCSSCGSPLNVNTPGLTGQSAFTFTAATFVVPALGAQVTIDVDNTDWMAQGMTVFIEGAGLFTVDTIISSTQVTLTYVNIASNTATGNTVAVDTLVTCACTGTNGTNGVNAYTVTTASFVVPAIGANVSNPDGFVHVSNNTWASVGQVVFISDGTDWGSFEVVSKPDTISFVAKFLGHNGDAAPGATIDAGAGVSPGGTEPPLAVALPTALTPNASGSAGATIGASVGIATVTIPLTSLATGLSTLAIDLLTTYTPGYAFELLSFDFVTTIVGAGAGASQVFNLEIGTTNVTGGVLTVTLASTNTIGAVTAGTAITAANTGTAASTISIEMAAGGTVFTSGSGYFLIRIRNTDTNDAVASLVATTTALIASLT